MLTPCHHPLGFSRKQTRRLMGDDSVSTSSDIQTLKHTVTGGAEGDEDEDPTAAASFAQLRSAYKELQEQYSELARKHADLEGQYTEEKARWGEEQGTARAKGTRGSKLDMAGESGLRNDVDRLKTEL